jgi:arylsulfatase A-like enzyme
MYSCGVVAMLLPSVALGADVELSSPNVLLIGIDDLNDWVEPLGGHPDVQTPHLVRLAEMGLTFTNAHCQSPLCNSSRCSLMTSLRPSTTGIYGLSPFFRNTEKWKDHVSLNQLFRSHGYETYYAGKIYHGQHGRNENEFDHIGPPGAPGFMPPKKLVPPTPAGNNPWVDWGVIEHDEREKGDHKVASWCVDRLRNLPDDQPFFIACGFFLPHVPCYAPPKWWNRYDHDSIRLPLVDPHDRLDCSPFSWYLHWRLPEPRMSWLTHYSEHRNLVHAYLACITFVDTQVGRVLEALEQSGCMDNTIVCLWSDHGYHLGEKNMMGKTLNGFASTRLARWLRWSRGRDREYWNVSLMAGTGKAKRLILLTHPRVSPRIGSKICRCSCDSRE